MRQWRTQNTKSGHRLALQFLAALFIAFVIPVSVSAASSGGITEKDISFKADGGLLLHGTIVAPTTPGPHPGLVMIGGSGHWTTAGFARDAAVFAQHGIVTLIYDKRTIGYSATHRDYSVLANDAIGGVALLRTQPNVNPDLVGVYGLSEGGWVAPLAATRTTSIAYVVTVGASGVSPSQQQSWQYSEWLHHAGVNGSLIQMMRSSIRFGVGLGLFPEANYDGVPVWRHVHQPILALWGAQDRHAVPAESSRIIAQALAQGGNTRYTIQFIPNASHDLHITHDNGFDDLDTLAPAYPETLAAWVNDLSRSSPRVSVETTQPEDVLSTPVTPLKWYEATWLQIITFFSMLLVFGSYPLVALIRHFHRRSAATPLRRPMRYLSACGFASVLGFFVYFAFLTSTDASSVGPVVLGNPITWLILRGLSLATVIATVWTGVQWYCHRSDITIARIQSALLLAAGVLFTAWATYWSLLIR